MVAVVQLVRASDCGSECRGFESHLPPAKKRKFERIFLFFCYCPNNPPKGGKKIVGILLTEYPYIIGRNQLPKPVLVQKSLLSQNVQNSWKLIPIFCILYQSHFIVLPSLLYQASDKTTRYHLIEIRIQKEYFIFQKTFYTNNSTIFDFRHANITLFVYTKSKISYLCKDEIQSNMKILWIDLNSSYAHSSLALPALHAQIAKNNSVKWEIVSATINENVGMIVDEIYRHQPDIIAATTWLFNHEQLLHITARLKALLPNSCFILGGPEFLGNNEDFLHKNPFIDCVFRGEGEEAFPQWLSCWNQPEKWNSIPGLCYMNPQKQYIDNGIARVLNFSRLVPPENSSFFNWSKPFVQLETTRGCFNTCAFCVSGEEKPVRTLSIESIRERLQIIHSHGIKNVRVLDRTFNYNPRRAKELLQLFLEFNPDICFHLEYTLHYYPKS